MKELTFTAFSCMNRVRCKAWMGTADRVEHHLLGLAGEVGELCNAWKKMDRAAYMRPGGVQPNLREISDEIADVAIYLDLVAAHYGIDLAAAIVSKFNATSEKYGFPHRIGD